MTSIDVCICTWRRASLRQALNSVAAQKLPENISVRIIVADNDETPSAADLVSEVAAQIPTQVIYVHAPARNISLARNACLDAAEGDWIAFLDDDEVAEPDWLATLLAQAMQHDAAAIFGPSIAVYAEDMPQWMREKEYHSNHPQLRGGLVETGHTCNALMRREDPAVRGKRFDLAKGLTGGEDTDFFFRVGADGGRLAIAPDAIVRERVDPARATFQWIAKRKFRAGQSYAMGAKSKGAVAVTVMALLKVLFSCLMALLQSWSRTERHYWALRAIFHAGVVAKFFGMREQELY